VELDILLCLADLGVRHLKGNVAFSHLGAYLEEGNLFEDNPLNGILYSGVRAICSDGISLTPASVGNLLAQVGSPMLEWDSHARYVFRRVLKRPPLFQSP
jgi:hypothetical protein